MTKGAVREAVEGYVWISPWIVGFVAFVLGPTVASFALAFTSYPGIGPANFIGLENYVRIFTYDDLFYGSVWKTFYYALASVPLGLAGSMFAALLLNQPLRLRVLFRTLFYLPSLTPTVALTILWLWILQPQMGLVNHLLRMVGIEGPGWFGTRTWAIPSLILMGLWAGIGGGRMIIFLAALQGVPEELYEAAEIDGANPVHKFLHVTFPMVSPAFLFSMIMGVIGALNVFQTAFIATEGGPARATWFLALHIYFNAFRYLRFGYASALAWIFLAIVLTLTILQMQWSGRWVYYETEMG
ncbi:MAG: sugar ABC transporter permease [Chloroflexi bacterium]|nr:sugar ABC transporter permease [Chloroflexota bacterium]